MSRTKHVRDKFKKYKKEILKYLDIKYERNHAKRKLCMALHWDMSPSQRTDYEWEEYRISYAINKIKQMVAEHILYDENASYGFNYVINPIIDEIMNTNFDEFTGRRK